MADDTEERTAQKGVFDAGRSIVRPQRGGLGYVTAPASQIPVFASTDVLVIGGGPAGTTAAIAAARTGASVILVERYSGHLAPPPITGPSPGRR